MSRRIRSTVWMTIWATLALGLSSVSCAQEPVLAPGDDDSPYRVGLTSPRLTTPQWVGEPGVDAVVILSIDDMTDNLPKYEAFLRPILDRLKQIDQRSPVSIFTCRTAPGVPGLQTMLKEGVSFEIHTTRHPCPLLQGGDFGSAAKTFHECVDLVSKIPNTSPVAFRMPCCDSLNSVSPRFYSEIFNKKSPEGKSLTIDSSVFTILTANDPELPRNVVTEPDGKSRFRKYLPVGKSFVNLIENYPYPYPIHRLAWEFPCIVPSDWEAQNLQKPNNPRTVEDLKAALDGVVVKKGVFTFVFHPHGWIRNDQVVSLIDHAVARYGSRVKFLTFKEAQTRLNQNLLKGHPLRSADGTDGGVRLVDLNADGYLDVLIGAGAQRLSRVWDPSRNRWNDFDLPVSIVEEKTQKDSGVRIGKVRGKGDAPSQVLLFAGSENQRGLWRFDGKSWTALPLDLKLETTRIGLDQGVRFIDIDRDGSDELVFANLAKSAVYQWDAEHSNWHQAPFTLPGSLTFIDEQGLDAGTRFVDLDEDGFLDVLQSNESREGIYLFEPPFKGWTRQVFDRPDSTKRVLPALVRQGQDLGAWFADRHLWIQNEFTAGKPDLVDRRSFNALLETVEPQGKSTKASLDSIQLQSGFRAELMASEPLVDDPIAFDWSADGRLWVVEMGDYPLGLDGKGQSGGKVRILEDTNGDDRLDRATTFLEGLPFPTGVMPWRRGVLISAAPDIIYAEDTNGDGKADIRKVLYTGFAPGNPQHRVNGFSQGLDGWIYAANGDSGGQITSTATGKAISISGRDFRFKPDTGEIEAESGQSQYGRWRDDWGRWLGNNNSEWAWQYVLSEADVSRNPAFRFTGARQSLGVPTRVYPASRTLPRFNIPSAANHVTSANSPTPYRDELFGPAFASAIFVSEPVHNLVRWINVEPNGPTVTGKLPAENATSEFLASSDNWFRPTSIRTGPDGGLWVADMYRAVIEHPEWIPDDWEAKLDLRAGADQGRIYRIMPVGVAPRKPIRLDRLDTSGLVAAVDSPNGWTRDAAQRLIQEKGGTSAVEGLAKLAISSPRPKSRLQAIWILANLQSLSPEVVKAALADHEPMVRRGAARLGLALAGKDQEVASKWLGLVNDPSPAVRLELACSLGNWDDLRAGEALAQLALKDQGEPWIRAAILTSAKPHAAILLTRLFEGSKGAPPSGLVEPLFASLRTESGREAIDRLRKTILTPQQDGSFSAWQFSALAGLGQAGKSEGFLGKPAESARMTEATRSLLANEETNESLRIAAIRAVPYLNFKPEEFRELLSGLLAPQISPEARRGAIEILGKTDDPKVASLLLAGWKGHTPATRDQVLETLLSRANWTASLLSSLEDTCTPPNEITGAYRDRLIRNTDRTFRDRATAVFASTPGSTREGVIAQYQAALTLKGEAARGSELFKKNCTNCHRFAGQGTEVGPDLSPVGEKPGDALLVAILDPSRAFEARYSSFGVGLKDGRLFTGLIAGESANAVTLRRADGKEDTLPRSEIAEMVGSGRSLMPEGLEKDLNPQAIADLIAFLRAGGTPPKNLPGNHPAKINPEADGSLKLTAATAEIRGDSLTFESHYGNLGYWSSANDRAGWSFQVPRTGRYQIRLDYACPNDSAGGALRLEVGPLTREIRLAGTGSWDDYKFIDLGEVELKAGEHRLDLRSAGPPKSALMDLRSVELKPIP